KLNSIPMEYSDIEDEFYDCESELEENKIELLDSENSDNEVINEEIFKISGVLRKRHAQVLSSSEDENKNIL
ncbi:hypothetical protein V1477_003495, partial [Vespula maculifrons]